MSKVFIISEGSFVQFDFHTYCMVDSKKNIATNVIYNMHYILLHLQTQSYSCDRLGGPYVSADDIPELAEIHLFDSSGGDFTVQQRRSALRGSS